MIDDLLKKIKEKKPLDKLDDCYIQELIEQYFRPRQKEYKKLQAIGVSKLERNALFKQTVKDIRHALNSTYGTFWNKDGHTSTKERTEIYPTLYKKIFALTGMPTSILDLGCGLNPLSYPFMDFNGDYTATELTKKDCEQLEVIFKQLKIKGNILQLNLLKAQTFPKADITFLFKILDVLEHKGHKFSEELLKKIPSTWIVVSFSTMTLDQRKMNYPKRGWIEQLLKRLGWEYTVLTYSNEIFYVIKKTPLN
ncbi:MAG: hypothetical protein WC595_04520 [Candidatus Nanoarchaeia archaeon]